MSVLSSIEIDGDGNLLINGSKIATQSYVDVAVARVKNLEEINYAFFSTERTKIRMTGMFPEILNGEYFESQSKRSLYASSTSYRFIEDDKSSLYIKYNGEFYYVLVKVYPLTSSELFNMISLPNSSWLVLKYYSNPELIDSDVDHEDKIVSYMSFLGIEDKYFGSSIYPKDMRIKPL
jgi:hypothetical protein